MGAVHTGDGSTIDGAAAGAGRADHLLVEALAAAALAALAWHGSHGCGAGPARAAQPACCDAGPTPAPATLG